MTKLGLRQSWKSRRHWCKAKMWFFLSVSSELLLISTAFGKFVLISEYPDPTHLPLPLHREISQTDLGNVLFFLCSSLLFFDPVNYKLALAMDTWYLPLQTLNHVLLIFSIPWKEFRVENRNEAFCAQGKTGRTSLQVGIFRSRFYEPNSYISSYVEKY